MQKRNKLIIYSGIIIFISVLLDLLTKYLVHINLYPYESITVIDNFFSIVYAKNTGSAFSFLSNAPVWFRKPFFIIIPLAAMLLIAFLIKNAIKEGKENKFQVYAFSMILGGALGNFINRISTGSVIDFLQFKLTRTYYWPSFNVADIAITIGVAILFIEMIYVEQKKKKSVKKNKKQ
jgi:signal peptidase II